MSQDEERPRTMFCEELSGVEADAEAGQGFRHLRCGCGRALPALTTPIAGTRLVGSRIGPLL
jgi:hypothetical protein